MIYPLHFLQEKPTSHICIKFTPVSITSCKTQKLYNNLQKHHTTSKRQMGKEGEIELGRNL